MSRPPPSAPRIRPATPADAPRLAALRYDFRAALDPPAEARDRFVPRCRDWMRERLTRGTWRCWVADLDDELAGSVWLHTLEKLPNPVGEPEFYGYISNLYVTRALRNTGLGGTLLATCLQACDADRLDAVFLWPTERSRTLYLRHGFSSDGPMMVRRTTPAPAHDGPA